MKKLRGDFPFWISDSQQIADGMLMAAFYHAGNDLAERAVPADAGDEVICIAQFPDELPGISGFFGQGDRTKVTATLKDMEDLADLFRSFAFSGFGADDEQQAFWQHDGESLLRRGDEKRI